MAERRGVALLIESSRIDERVMLRGVGSYVCEHESWSISYRERALRDAAPAWMQKWRGDGIIARVESRQLAQQITEMKLPTVDSSGRHRIEGIPVVMTERSVQAHAAALALNRIAISIVNSEEDEIRELAAAYARKASQIVPASWEVTKTLGVAEYRCGNWEAAIVHLSRANSLLGGKTYAEVSCLPYLASAFWKLGYKRIACSYYSTVSSSEYRTYSTSGFKEVDRLTLREAKQLIGESKSGTAVQLVHTGGRLFVEGKIEEARLAYEEALALEPK